MPFWTKTLSIVEYKQNYLLSEFNLKQTCPSRVRWNRGPIKIPALHVQVHA